MVDERGFRGFWSKLRFKYFNNLTTESPNYKPYIHIQLHISFTRTFAVVETILFPLVCQSKMPDPGGAGGRLGPGRCVDVTPDHGEGHLSAACRRHLQEETQNTASHYTGCGRAPHI